MVSFYREHKRADDGIGVSLERVEVSIAGRKDGIYGYVALYTRD